MLAQLEPSPLCPSCSRREQTTAAGMCDECTVQRVAERYAEKDNASARARVLAWVERTEHGTHVDAHGVTLRQQRSRLLAKMRPRDPAPPGVDPLALGSEALDMLTRMRYAIEHFPEERRRLEEIVRRLSWGPDRENTATAPKGGHRVDGADYR